MVSNTTKLAIVYVLAIATYTAVVLISEIIRHPILSVSDSINILLALTVAIFTLVQGMSALTQYENQKKTNYIEGLRNELEKAYAPLFTLLNNRNKTDEKSIKLTEDQKWNLDLILATYSLPSTIKEYWKTNIQRLETTMSEEIKEQTKYPIRIYLIPTEFRDMVNTEYEKCVKEYSQLLKGEKTL